MRTTLETDVEPGNGSPPVIHLTTLSTLASSSKEKVETLTVVQNDVISFPEGGLQGWMAVLGGFLVQYSCLGYITSFGVYQDFYVRQYLKAYSPSAIGWIGGVQIFLAFSCGAFSGRLFDKGYFRAMMITTIILYALGLFSLSVSHENSYYQVFLSHGIAFGLATGVTYVPSIAISGHYFHKKRPLAVGIISSGSALGAVVQPIMLNRFINGNVGFHNGVRISAGINIVLLILATLLARTRLPPKKTQKHVSVSSLLREPAYAALVAASVFAFFGLFYPFFYLQLNAVTHHVDSELAFYSTSILNAASVFGRWIPGLAAPYFGVLNIGLFTTLGTGIVIFTMTAVHDKTGTILFAIFFGLFSGSLIASTPAMSARHAKDHTEIGVRMGLFFAMGGLVGLFATPISGALLTSQYHWLPPTVFAGAATCVGGMFCGIARMVTSRQEKTWKV